MIKFLKRLSGSLLRFFFVMLLWMEALEGPLSVPFGMEEWGTEKPEHSICRVHAGVSEIKYGVLTLYQEQIGVLTTETTSPPYQVRFTCETMSYFFTVTKSQLCEKRSEAVFLTLHDDPRRQGIKPLHLSSCLLHEGDNIVWPHILDVYTLKSKFPGIYERVSYPLSSPLRGVVGKKNDIQFVGPYIIADYEGGPLFNTHHEIIGLQGKNPLIHHQELTPMDYGIALYLGGLYMLTALYDTRAFYGTPEGLFINVWSRLLWTIPNSIKRLVSTLLFLRNVLWPFLTQGMYTGKGSFVMIRLPTILQKRF